MKKFFLTTSIVAALSSLFILLKADLSLQQIAPERLNDKNHRDLVCLISYADGNEVFYKNQHALVYSAQNKGFDAFISYRKSLLGKDFLEKNKEILRIKTGAGLWVWKPQILLQTMRMTPENSIIFYVDTGFIFVRDPSELKELLIDSDVILMNIDEYASKEKLKSWLPNIIADESGVDKNLPKFIESGFIIIKNTHKAKEFIQRWLEICEKHAFTKYDNKEEGLKGFTYDQSLLSIIAYKFPEKVKIVPKEQFKKYTVFHHRHPGNNKPLLPLQVLPLKQIREWLGKYFPDLFLKIGF